ncbi:MAG: pyridoxamine 5'-phosphate oxidase family protein [Anaerolineales bacterium]|nr:pyridoxamine 5'-phosphate oxidase family protein [Anaerolineales bacterium]
MPSSMSEVEGFLQRERVAAFCTVDSNNKPHAVPVFFTYDNGKLYIQTNRKSVKVHNLLTNSNVAITVYSGEFGEQAVVIRGQACIVGDDEFVIRTQEHIRKYQLQLDEQGRDNLGIPLFDSRTRCVLEITLEHLKFW